MIEAFLAVFYVINTQIFIISVLLFFIGYVLAPTIYFKKVKWLTAYPFYIIKLMDLFFKKKHHPLKVFFILFGLNTFSLSLNLISAWGVFLPYLMVIYMGMNIGVVMYHVLEGHFYYLGLFNPVALLELPAAWLSIAMAIQFSLTHFFGKTGLEHISFDQYVIYFMSTVIPLLLVAGIIETILIVRGVKEDNQEF
jgi:uncharacterized membrane protein SpoIIM required for sporulation